MKPQREIINHSNLSSFTSYQYEQEEFYPPWHFHPEYELTYIVSSQGKRYVGTNVEHFEEGDLVLLGPNLPHCWKNPEKYHQEATSIVVEWEGDILDKSWLNKSEFLSIKNLYKQSLNGIKFNSRVARKILPDLEDLLAKTSFDKMMQLLKVLHKLAITNEIKLISDADFSSGRRDINNARLSKVYKYVKENYRKQFMLEETASLLSMSEESFCRFFSQKNNEPFFTFVNRYKIDAVCQHLINSQNQVAQIAYENGFNNLSFFYRQFKKFKRCTPTEYRTNYQKALSGSFVNSMI
jgi:AraC-like DNA-binding protein/mannose-6-phosphate isomerase-like protein (cupin superfamily)